MNNLNIESVIHHFGLDHLEIFGSFKDESLFDKLDFDNSNYWEFDWYNITKNEVPKYQYKILFTKWDYSLFAYYKWVPKWDSQPVATKDYVTIYSTAFKLLEYEEILGFLEWYMKLTHCRRFDICMDLKVEIDELLENYFNNYSTGRDYRKGKKTETRYFWELKKSQNKRQVIRVYNKNLDILQKKKVSLYQEYLVENHITRVELEVRQELAKTRSYKDIFDNMLLIWIFKNYIYKYSKIFDSIQAEKQTLYKAKKIKLDAEKYQSLYYKNFRKNMFIWHARTIYNMWFCPVRVLIWEWYIQDKTKIILWAENIEDIYDKERIAIQNAKYEKFLKENIAEILDNQYKYGKL